MKPQHLYRVFEKFTTGIGSHDPYEICQILFQRYTVDDYAYHDDMYFFGVIKYFETVVIPHKIEVYKAGMELLEKLFPVREMKSKVLKNLYYHDLSKFSANEAFGYAMYDFNKVHLPDSPEKQAFEGAWHHHKMNNPHHPEYWLNPNRSGKLEILPMPVEYIIEMVADWIGAGKSYGNPIENWLHSNLSKFKFHSTTAHTLQEILHNTGLIGFKTYFHPEEGVIKPE